MSYLSRGHFFSEYTDIEEASRHFYDSIFGWRSDVPHFRSMSPTVAVNALIQRVRLVVVSKKISTSSVGESQRMYSIRNLDGDLTRDDIENLANRSEIAHTDLVREIEVDDNGQAKVRTNWRPVGEVFPDFFHIQSKGLLSLPSLSTTGQSLNTFVAYIHAVPPRLSVQGSELFEMYFEPKLTDKVVIHRSVGGPTVQSLDYRRFSRRLGTA